MVCMWDEPPRPGGQMDNMEETQKVYLKSWGEAK